MQYFDHEKLKVYQKALDFVEWSGSILKNIEGNSVIRDQLDRASISISLNIAEGNGKYHPKDRCRYFDISRGSALESSACLDILVKRHLIEIDLCDEGKQMLNEIVAMIVGLIRSNSDRVFEAETEYKISEENKTD